MSEGKKMTLADLFARKRAEQAAAYAERLAYEATPEGKAEKEAREAEERRLMAADLRFAEENPIEDDEDDEDDED